MSYLIIWFLAKSLATESPSVRDALCVSDIPTADQVCQLSKSACRDTYGVSCRETDLNQILSRLSNLDLQRKTFEKTKHFFENLKGDEKVTNLCCQEDQTCRLRLTQVSFKVARSLPEVQLAYFHLGSEQKGEIIFSDSRLLASNTFDDIENTLLHEWGHACQFARNPEADSLYCDEVYGGGLLTLATATKDIGAVFDKKLENCVSEALITSKDIPNETAANHCLSARGSEAFADLFLLKNVKGLYGWERICLAKKNESHEFPRVYLNCWIRNQKIRKEVCEYKEASTKGSAEAVQ